jgi:hypothetical protein
VKNHGGRGGPKGLDGSSPKRALIAKNNDVKSGVIIVDEGKLDLRVGTYGNHDPRKSGIRGVKNNDEIRDHRNYIIDKKLKDMNRSPVKASTAKY